MWYWLCNITQYIERFGADILDAKVKRLFLSDNHEDYYFDESNMQFLYNRDALIEVNKTGREQTVQ